MIAAMPSEPTIQAIVHVVDDDASLRKALESLFESVGLAARTYGTAQDFLGAKVADAPGCVVIDIRLPDMSGLEFQSRLTAIGIRLPVIVITGYGDIPMSVRAMKGGAMDFLSKPFRDQDLLDAVQAAIKRDRERRVIESDVSGVKAGDATCGDWKDEQAGRGGFGNQRNHGEDSPRGGNAQDGR